MNRGRSTRWRILRRYQAHEVCVYCRKLTNTSPTIYLNQLRVSRAKEIMRNEPGRALTDIAFDRGFASSQYFATVFRLYAGCSPSDFRQES